ncbi:MAG: GTPase ObgE [Chloroflexi bacterium]|nr:GTPase ObgE [Chloroflexota bacterium]
MFIDEAIIFVRSGSGGGGMVHFRKEKYINKGGPDGGDGGRGGDVVLQVRSTLNTLSTFRHKTRFIAGDGAGGGKQRQTGRSAEELVILVPPGTIVYEQDTGETLGDLVYPDQRLVICKGGRGGRGNVHFTTSRNQAPRLAEKGEPGEEKNLRLELKLIADVGIVGVPNAGKSSLLAAVTNARPKIAGYPFTTIEPNLGVHVFDLDESLVLADIPGLIEGAHEGRGLGIAFLRHIQRTRVLIHVLDGLSADPLADFTQTNSELALFDPDLIKKPQIVALNKIDQPQVLEQHKKMIKALEKKGYPVFVISVLAQTNLDLLLLKALELVKQTPEPEPVETMPVYRAVEDPNAFTIEKEEDGYRVKSKALVRAAEMTYWEYDASIRRFQRLLEHMGIDKALREEGIQEGDTVYIGDYELEWHD